MDLAGDPKKQKKNPAGFAYLNKIWDPFFYKTFSTSVQLGFARLPKLHFRGLPRVGRHAIKISQITTIQITAISVAQTQPPKP